MKRILIVGLSLVMFAAGFLLGSTVNQSGNDEFETTEDSVVETLGDIPGGNEKEIRIEENISEEAEGEEETEGTEVDIGALPEGQRTLLRALGIEGDTVTLTPQMIACAEAKVGTERLEEIQNGATPSFSEGLSLFGCYRQ